jgi:hypothetical protein
MTPTIINAKYPTTTTTQGQNLVNSSACFKALVAITSVIIATRKYQ